MNASLVDILRQRTTPLDITIDEEKSIVALNYDYDATYEVGIIFAHPEGAIIIGTDRPSNRVYQTLDNADFNLLPFDQKKKVVMAAFAFYRLYECPWIERNMNGKILRKTDNEANLMHWLDEPVSDEHFLHWVPVSLSPYLPGFEIMKNLRPEVRVKLGMQQMDLGGPSSGGCMVVIVDASPTDLNKALIDARLPFRVADGLPVSGRHE